MASVAPGPKVRQIEPQIRPNLDRYLVVGVKVSIVAMIAIAKFCQHDISGRHVEPSEAELSNDLGFPSAIDASPVIAFEAKDSQFTMLLRVAALRGCGALLVVHLVALVLALIAQAAAFNQPSANIAGTLR